MKELHPAVIEMLENFEYSHLPGELQLVSQNFHDLAHELAAEYDGAEATAGLRKLLEAKDCFVRCAVRKMKSLP